MIEAPPQLLPPAACAAAAMQTRETIKGSVARGGVFGNGPLKIGMSARNAATVDAIALTPPTALGRRASGPPRRQRPQKHDRLAAQQQPAGVEAAFSSARQLLRAAQSPHIIENMIKSFEHKGLKKFPAGHGGPGLCHGNGDSPGSGAGASPVIALRLLLAPPFLPFGRLSK